MSAPQTYRQRYIAFKVKNEDKPVSEEMKRNVVKWKKDLDLSPPPWLIQYDEETREGIIRCGHLQTDRLKDKIKAHKEPQITVLGVSGTIKKTKKKFLSV